VPFFEAAQISGEELYYLTLDDMSTMKLHTDIR
jgi:hypothetical protein